MLSIMPLLIASLAALAQRGSRLVAAYFVVARSGFECSTR
jgi:hypothetical protein